MSQTYTAVIQKDGEWWVGWVKEIRGVNAQERTHEELLGSLRYALKDMLDLNEAHALDIASTGYDMAQAMKRADLITVGMKGLAR